MLQFFNQQLASFLQNSYGPGKEFCPLAPSPASRVEVRRYRGLREDRLQFPVQPVLKNPSSSLPIPLLLLHINQAVLSDLLFRKNNISVADRAIPIIVFASPEVLGSVCVTVPSLPAPSFT